MALESIRVGRERGVKRVGALREQVFGISVVDSMRRHQSDPGVAMAVVVPVEKLLAVGSGILQAAEAVREFRTVFKGLKI